MSDDNVADAAAELVAMMRARWDKLGYIEADGGAFATGHTPDGPRLSYLCYVYAGLSAAGLDDAEAESERYLPEPYRDFLSVCNGARILGISLHGSTGGQNLRNPGSVGQPISIRYQNAFYLRPEFIPEGHFGLGAMNGPYYSQGHLYLTSSGEVELINREYDLVAQTWPSLADFLRREGQRQMSRFDDAGRELDLLDRLPGNTENWEALGKATTDARQKGTTVLQKTLRKLGISRDP